MGVVQARPRPAPEAIIYDGSNVDEVHDLVQRVADLGVWSVLPAGTSVGGYVKSEPPELGLHLQNDDGLTVARVEEGNVLVFDPFATTPLFVVGPDEFAALYEEV